MGKKVHGRGTVYNPLVTDELLEQVNPENMQLKKDFCLIYALLIEHLQRWNLMTMIWIISSVGIYYTMEINSL